MKTNFKLLFTLAIVILSLLAFTVISSAATLTVGGEGSDYSTFKDAETAAQNGDTIVVEADITSDINLTQHKSLDIVLKANLLGGLRVSYATANEVSLTIRTEGTGARTINFKKSCDSSQGLFGGGYGNNLSTKYTINFFGTEDAPLILDGSNFGYGLNNALKNLTVNTKFVEIKNFNTQNSQPLLNCGTFNVYDGTKIYNNTTSGPLFVGTTLNLYGGEFYNNTTTAKIMFNLKNTNLLGGSIHDNYLTNTAATGFMIFEYGNENVYRFFAGSIYNNYVHAQDTSPAFISASKWNSKSMINLACVGENYYYNSADNTVAPTVLKNFSNISYGDISYAVVFKAKDGAYISAYAMHKGAYDSKYALVDKSGTAVTAIIIPEGYTWTDSLGNCQEVTVDTTKQGVYYALGDHKYNDDFDCTTALVCITCNKVTVDAGEHELKTIIVYENGYTANGKKSTICAHENCTAANSSIDTRPLFISLGYSKDTTSNAIVFNIISNNEAIYEYENSIDSDFKYGIGVKIADSDENIENDTIFDESCSLKANALAINFNNKNYSKIQTKISSIGEDNYNTYLHCSGYVIENGKVTYINGSSEGAYAEKVSYYSIPNEE